MDLSLYIADRESFGSTLEYSLQEVKKFLGSALGKDFDPDLLIYARVGGKIVAAVGVTYLGYPGENRDKPVTAYLSGLKVAHAFRKQGVAKSLMLKAIEELDRRGTAAAFAVTLTRHTHMTKLLTNHLGNTTEITRDHILGYVPKDLMRRFNKANTYWCLDVKSIVDNRRTSEVHEEV